MKQFSISKMMAVSAFTLMASQASYAMDPKVFAEALQFANSFKGLGINTTDAAVWARKMATQDEKYGAPADRLASYITVFKYVKEKGPVYLNTDGLDDASFKKMIPADYNSYHASNGAVQIPRDQLLTKLNDVQATAQKLAEKVSNSKNPADQTKIFLEIEAAKQPRLTLGQHMVDLAKRWQSATLYPATMDNFGFGGNVGKSMEYSATQAAQFATLADFEHSKAIGKAKNGFIAGNDGVIDCNVLINPFHTAYGQIPRGQESIDKFIEACRKTHTHPEFPIGNKEEAMKATYEMVQVGAISLQAARPAQDAAVSQQAVTAPAIVSIAEDSDNEYSLGFGSMGRGHLRTSYGK